VGGAGGVNRRGARLIPVLTSKCERSCVCAAALTWRDDSAPSMSERGMANQPPAGERDTTRARRESQDNTCCHGGDGIPSPSGGMSQRGKYVAG